MYLQHLLTPKLTQLKGGHFPWKFYRNSPLRNVAVIGVGGNVGDTKRVFEKLFWYLKRDKKLDLLQTASLLKNPPFGYKEQHDFLNTIAVVQTSLQPKELLRHLQGIENYFRRKKSFRNAPRTLDLDIIFFNNIQLQSKELTIPHKAWHTRESVVIPLLEVAV